MEEWRKILQFPLYEATGDGKIRRIGSKRLMIGSTDRKGYRKVRVDGRKMRLVHRLENLEYVTRSQNQRHSVDVLGKPAPSGMIHGMSKLTDSQVQEIRTLRPSIGLKRVRINSGPFTLAAIAERYGVSPAMVSLILNRRNWKHI